VRGLAASRPPSRWSASPRRRPAFPTI
jgi:hypothetical protein